MIGDARCVSVILGSLPLSFTNHSKHATETQFTHTHPFKNRPHSLPPLPPLPRYTGHTQSCARCRAALNNIKAARQVLSCAAGALAAAALLGAAVAVALSATAGVTAGPAVTAVITAAGAPGRLAAAALGVACWVAGVGGGAGLGAGAGAGGAMLRALGLGLGALLAWRVAEGVLGGLEQKFYRGEYPPPRNVDKRG